MSREDLFSPNQAREQGHNTRDVMRDDFGWEVPVDQAPLPSRGILYDKESTLYQRETVDIRAMTAKEEDILMSQAYIKQGVVIDKLLESCIIDKSIDVSELLVGDRNTILVALRVTGFGADYNASTTCEHCDARTTTTFDLTSLKLKNIDIKPVEQGVNEFEVHLPVSNKLATVSLMTTAVEKDIRETEIRNKEVLGINPDGNRVTTRLTNIIQSIDGIRDRNKLKKFIESMPLRDSRTIRQFIRNNEPGIDMKTSYNCGYCNQEAQVTLSLGLNFLWPSV
jgi:hypothetical protein